MKLKTVKNYPLSLLCSLGVVVMSLAPIGAPEIARDVPLFDKWAHFVMYGTLTLVVWWELHRKPHLPVSLCRLLTFGVAYPVLLGILMELGQAFLTTYRSGDAWDAVANSIGVGLGCLVGAAVRRCGVES